MTSPAFEVFLARLYTDRETRDRFLAAPEPEARAANLSEAEVAALLDIDREGLRLAARSFELKRTKRKTECSIR